MPTSTVLLRSDAPSTPMAAPQTRRVSGNWTLLAMFAGALIGSTITMQAGFPWPNPMASGPGGDVDLLVGMAAGAPLAGAAFATAVRRAGATFVTPEWIDDLRRAGRALD